MGGLLNTGVPSVWEPAQVLVLGRGGQKERQTPLHHHPHTFSKRARFHPGLVVAPPTRPIHHPPRAVTCNGKLGGPLALAPRGKSPGPKGWGNEGGSAAGPVWFGFESIS